MEMDATVAIRQLTERGALPANVVFSEGCNEIVSDPDDPSKVILKAEVTLRARARHAVQTKSAIPWSEVSVPERLLFRQQHNRLGLKRLANGNIYARGRFGVRCRRELLSAISAAKGGLDCFEVFEEYPQAHEDVISLISDGKIATVATTLWAPHRT